ncbi:MAG TPA: hypothetical protein VIN08_06430 [Ohtaekwangia sp.]|uniref:hypothetical protein n=1 Tax=Ohtaekwangia sp. TaxID=2066019 RepID=UPI002F947815
MTSRRVKIYHRQSPIMPGLHSETRQQVGAAVITAIIVAAVITALVIGGAVWIELLTSN